MNLFVCGNAGPLLDEPRPCPRYYMDKSNPCIHVSSGKVNTNEACPYMATKPTASPTKSDAEIIVRSLAAENVLIVQQGPDTKLIHCMDGYDRTVEPSTIGTIQEKFGAGLQDTWVNGSPNVSIEDDLFGDDYPRGSVVDLGLLTRDGGIWEIKQDPVRIKELTTPLSRKPFLHALFRKEVNNDRQDVWPCVVFPQQPNICYRIRTLAGLLSWLQGEKSVEVWHIIFPSPVRSLSTNRFRGEKCCAVLESGEVYYWNRDDNVGKRHSSTLQDALYGSPTDQAAHVKDGKASVPALMDIPAVKKIALGLETGIAVAQDGILYVISLARPAHKDLHMPHLTDLDDGSPEHRIARPFSPQRASINDRGSKFIDVAAGDDHVVALSSDGRVYTAGGGFQGQLGIGQKQFELDNEDPKSYEWSHECVQYSEDWQEVALPTSTGQKSAVSKKVVKVAAGFQSTLMLCTDSW